jgi:chromosome segregation ATPase
MACFLTKYQSLKTNNTTPMKIKFQKAWAFALAFFGLAETKEEDLPEVTAEHIEKLSAECTRLSDALGQADKDKEALSAQVEALGADKTNLTAEVEKLKGDLAAETKSKEAFSALAEKYRGAAGEAFQDPNPGDKKDELSGDDPKDKTVPVAESTVFKKAMAEINNL